MPPHELAELTAARLELLAAGEIEVEGRMPWSSNATFLVTVTSGDDCCQAIYKPLRGERPLWDFPAGLYRREVAAFAQRCDRLLARGRFPGPRGDAPAIPWPPF